MHQRWCAESIPLITVPIKQLSTYFPPIFMIPAFIQWADNFPTKKECPEIVIENVRVHPENVSRVRKMHGKLQYSGHRGINSPGIFRTFSKILKCHNVRNIAIFRMFYGHMGRFSDASDVFDNNFRTFFFYRAISFENALSETERVLVDKNNKEYNN